MDKDGAMCPRTAVIGIKDIPVLLWGELFTRDEVAELGGHSVPMAFVISSFMIRDLCGAISKRGTGRSVQNDT